MVAIVFVPNDCFLLLGPKRADVKWFPAPSQVSKAIAVTLFQKENGLKLIKNILHKGPSHLKTTAISLTANLSRHHELRPFIGNFTLQLQILFSNSLLFELYFAVHQT